MVLHRIDPPSCAKILGVVYALLGLIIGVVFASVSFLSSGFGGSEMSGFAGIFGVAAVIVFPIMYGLLGIIGGFIMAGLYNFAAARIGGVDLELD